MTQAPVELETTPAFEPPSNTQFSVFLDNRVGKLMDLVEVFTGQPLTLAGFSVIDSADHAVVRVLTSNALLAARLLERNALPFAQDAVLVVELSRGQTLPRLCQTLLQAEMNIHYAYPLMVRPHGAPAVVMHTDDMHFTGQLLRRKLFTLLAENDLGENAPGSGTGTPNDPNVN